MTTCVDLLRLTIANFFVGICRCVVGVVLHSWSNALFNVNLALAVLTESQLDVGRG